MASTSGDEFPFPVGMGTRRSLDEPSLAEPWSSMDCALTSIMSTRRYALMPPAQVDLAVEPVALAEYKVVVESASVRTQKTRSPAAKYDGAFQS